MKPVNGMQDCCWSIPCAVDVQAEAGLFIPTLVKADTQFLSAAKCCWVRNDLL